MSLTFNSDFIMQSSTPTDPWKTKISNMLQKYPEVFGQRAIVGKKEEKNPEEYYFYLENIEGITPNTFRVVEKTLGNRCCLKQIPVNNLGIQRAVVHLKPPKPRFNFRETRVYRMCSVSTKRERYLALFSIFGIIITSLLLYYHWRDHADPWKYMLQDLNLKKYATPSSHSTESLKDIKN